MKKTDISEFCLHGACIFHEQPCIELCRECDGYNVPEFDGEEIEITEQ